MTVPPMISQLPTGPAQKSSATASASAAARCCSYQRHAIRHMSRKSHSKSAMQPRWAWLALRQLSSLPRCSAFWHASRTEAGMSSHMAAPFTYSSRRAGALCRCWFACDSSGVACVSSWSSLRAVGEEHVAQHDSETTIKSRKRRQWPWDSTSAQLVTFSTWSSCIALSATTSFGGSVHWTSSEAGPSPTIVSTSRRHSSITLSGHAASSVSQMLGDRKLVRLRTTFDSHRSASG